MIQHRAMGFDRRKLEDQRREAAELWMREIMYRLLIVGILIISTMPLSAQGQQPDAAKLNGCTKSCRHHQWR